MSETTAKPTLMECRKSLTGYDKIAIAQAFGSHLEELADGLILNAFAFILKRRDGLSDAEAKKAALNMTDDEIEGLFSDESEDDSENGLVEPTTEVGKGEPRPE